jgi:hypothetical protein
MVPWLLMASSMLVVYSIIMYSVFSIAAKCRIKIFKKIRKLELELKDIAKKKILIKEDEEEDKEIKPHLKLEPAIKNLE